MLFLSEMASLRSPSHRFSSSSASACGCRSPSRVSPQVLSWGHSLCRVCPEGATPASLTHLLKWDWRPLNQPFSQECPTQNSLTILNHIYVLIEFPLHTVQEISHSQSVFSAFLIIPHVSKLKASLVLDSVKPVRMRGSTPPSTPPPSEPVLTSPCTPSSVNLHLLAGLWLPTHCSMPLLTVCPLLYSAG